MYNKEYKIIKINNQLKKIKHERLALIKNKSIIELGKITPELNKLSDKYRKLQEELNLLQSPNFSNKIIDLYLDEEKSDKEQSGYYITLSGEKKSIGYIRIIWQSYSPLLENIGYYLEHDYRGHHYALQALELLRDYLIEHGLTRPKLTAYPDNVASIKTIENFGGVLIKTNNKDQDWNTYEVDLIKNKSLKKQ